MNAEPRFAPCADCERGMVGDNESCYTCMGTGVVVICACGACEDRGEQHEPHCRFWSGDMPPVVPMSTVEVSCAA
jgi:hypothetical protein